MGQYLQCGICGNWSIEVIGDMEFPCELCSDKYYDDNYELKGGIE